MLMCTFGLHLPCLTVKSNTAYQETGYYTWHKLCLVCVFTHICKQQMQNKLHFFLIGVNHSREALTSILAVMHKCTKSSPSGFSVDCFLITWTWPWWQGIVFTILPIHLRGNPCVFDTSKWMTFGRMFHLEGISCHDQNLALSLIKNWRPSPQDPELETTGIFRIWQHFQTSLRFISYFATTRQWMQIPCCGMPPVFI